MVDFSVVAKQTRWRVSGMHTTSFLFLLVFGRLFLGLFGSLVLLLFLFGRRAATVFVIAVVGAGPPAGLFTSRFRFEIHNFILKMRF